MMEFASYRRQPFVVDAVQITEDNIYECAALVGEVVDEEDQIDPYIRINKRLVPNINRAYVGWWVTRMEDNLRVYSPKIFADSFEPNI